MKIIGVEFRAGTITMGNGNLSEVALLPVELEFPAIVPKHGLGFHLPNIEIVGDFTIHTDRGDRAVPQFTIGYLNHEYQQNPSIPRDRMLVVDDQYQLDGMLRNWIKHHSRVR